LDEPTTSLTETEAARLFKIIQSLKSRGIAVVYISHNLGHVMKICDDVVVLRDGRVQAHGPRQEFDLDRMISLMVGRTIDRVFPERRSRPAEAPLLEVNDLTQPGLINRVSFTLHRGEVLGLSGLMGAGRTELARILFGLDPYASGRISIEGKPLRPSPKACIDRGMALVTESRRDDGLLMDSPVLENVVLASLGTFSTRIGGFFRRGRAARDVQQATSRLSVACRSLTKQPVKTLSGGNQQKIVLGKWLLAQPQAIILDEPTRGVDVGAKVEIYRLITDLVAAGSGVLIISSELEELVGLCDRILVMTAGEIRSEVRHDDFDREHLLREAFGRERIG
jgi:ribose transport system ATP-binding protein